MKAITVLMADDHAIFREGLRAILDRQKDIVVVGEARDGAEPSNLLRRGVRSAELTTKPRLSFHLLAEGLDIRKKRWYNMNK